MRAQNRSVGAILGHAVKLADEVGTALRDLERDYRAEFKALAPRDVDLEVAYWPKLPGPFGQFLADHGLDATETGVRTKRLLDYASRELVTRGRDEEQARDVVRQALAGFELGVDQKDLSQYLLFVGRQAIDLLTGYADTHWDDLLAKVTAEKEKAEKEKKRRTKDGDAPEEKKTRTQKAKPNAETLREARRILDASRVADIALFGRMIANNKDFNVDAACQVAHALSTHAVNTEFDFYTAVDDLKPDGEAGADMIGTIDFNAACYYRYVNLDTGQLAANLGGDLDLVGRTTRAWLYSFVHAVPSGKQNSMAALTPPSALLGVVRERGNWNLANAFLKPVSGADLAAASANELTDHFGQVRRFYGDQHLRQVVAASVTGSLSHLAEEEQASTLDEFATRVLAGVKA